MNACIAHRGPDAEGLWAGHDIVLGHRRLSIIDTSAAGNQPFFSDDGKIVLVFNGEIYNYLELKKELQDHHSFVTKTDTEVLIAAYRRWGIDCLHRFNGMFGFALHDASTGETFLVRDRLGEKPVYYASTSLGFAFASEMRPLLKCGLLSPTLSLASLTDYLRYQTVHAPATIVNEVKMVRAGHYLHFREGSMREVQYWNASTPTPQEIRPEHVHSDILNLLTTSVEMRMRADVPFGAFLSGGIDSSIIVGLMSRVATQKVKTFSITFYEEDFDESPYSRLIAQRFQTDHTEIRLKATDFLDDLEGALKAMDHPSGDGPNTYTVSKHTRAAGVKMALSGLGGDEVFAGYAIFKRMADLEENKLARWTPQFLRDLSAAALNKLKPNVAGEKIAESLRQERLDFEHLYPLHRQVLMDGVIREMLKDAPLSHNPLRDLTSMLAKTNLPLLSQVSVAEMTTYMQNVLLRDSDQMSMAHALEVRVPFLDPFLVEYVLQVGDALKYPHTPKQLLTESVGDLIPRDIIDRPKMGFTFPWAHWMKHELRSFCEEHLQSVDQHPLFVQGSVISLWRRFLAGDARITWSRLWPLVVLGHWMKENNVR